MDDYLTTFREAVYDAIAVYVNPHDYNRLIEGLGSDFTPSMDASTQTVDLFALMGGCVGMYSSVKVCLDPNVPLGTVRRSVGF